jgi:hypothetical protein
MLGFEPRTYDTTEWRLRPRSHHGWTKIEIFNLENLNIYSQMKAT